MMDDAKSRMHTNG